MTGALEASAGKKMKRQEGLYLKELHVHDEMGVHACSVASNPRTSQLSSPLKSTRYHKRTRELLNSCSFASTECHCIILKLQSDSLKKKKK